MKIRQMLCAMTIALMVATLAGCTAARKTSTPQSSGSEVPEKKEYNWKDLSTGGGFYRQAKPTPAY